MTINNETCQHSTSPSATITATPWSNSSAETTTSATATPVSSADQGGLADFASYSAIIATAFQSLSNKRLKLEEMYQFIQQRFPFFYKAKPLWKKGIRRRLNSDNCFIKLPIELSEPGKGQYWTINPASNFIIDEVIIGEYFGRPQKYFRKAHPCHKRRKINII